MAWSFNPFTGNLDLVGAGALVFEGEVETFDDLPATVGDPAVGASYLVRTSTGVWLVNRRQSGIWIRKNNTGVRATDWEYGGDYPVNSVNGQTGNVSLGPGDVGAEPIDYTIVNGPATLTNGAKVAADTTAGAFTLTLPATPSNGDTVSIFDRKGTFDTNNLILGRNGSLIEGLAEDLDCNLEDAAFSLVYVDATTGWKVMPYYGSIVGELVRFLIACSDETTNLTTGAAKVTFRAPFAFTLTGVRASVSTAPVGSTLVVDVNKGGTSVLSTKLSIDPNERSSVTAATPAVISDSSFSDDDEITIDIDQIGSTVAGKGLKVALIGTRS